MKNQAKMGRNLKLFLIIFSAVILNRFSAISRQPDTISLKLNDSIVIDCKLIHPGEFLLGSPDSDPLAGVLEKPRRYVVMKQAFYLGLTTVTIKQFEVFIKETGYKTIAETDGVGGHGFNEEKLKFEGLFPRYNWKYTGWIQSANDPVVNISLIDAHKFCEWLSKKLGKTIRLPTEGEWEYACRAGTNTIYFTGDSASSLKDYANVFDDALSKKLDSNFNRTLDRSFSFNDGYAFTAPVASFKPNPWGLYDMIGNTYELCDGIFSIDEPAREYNNIVKGGAYNSTPEFLRCAFRGSVKATSKYGYISFRIAVD